MNAICKTVAPNTNVSVERVDKIGGNMPLVLGPRCSIIKD